MTDFKGMAAREQIARPVYGRVHRALESLSSAARQFLLLNGQLDAVQAGRLLLCVQGLFVVLVADGLGASDSDVFWLAIVSMIMVGLLAGSYLVDWSRLPATAPLALAGGSIAAFFILGVFTAATFAPVTGFLTLTIVYVGLTQPARVALALVPFAGIALAVNYTPITSAIVIRVVVAMAVWLVTVSALCWLTRSNHDNAAQLRASAFIDALTGLPNRRDLDARLQDGIGNDQMIVVLDLDRFKRINDTAGHAAGDAVLRRFGTLLREQLRSGDYCARLGGEEFVIVFGPATTEAHQAVLGRLRAQWKRAQPDVTFSTGAARGRDNVTAQQSLATADRALYLAKSEGRNTDRTEHDLDTKAHAAAATVT